MARCHFLAESDSGPSFHLKLGLTILGIFKETRLVFTLSCSFHSTLWSDLGHTTFLQAVATYAP